jgi:uncharacterized membrane protein
VRLLRDRIRTSLWFAPVIAVCVAAAAAALLLAVDHRLQRQHGWFLFEGGPDSARELLSTITSSMLTFTALVFSITVLVLQLASSQFSPRVIRTFLESRWTKLAMATFVGTFVYAMIVLSQVISSPPFVPAVATWSALMLVMVSVAVFIRYVHHMAHSVRAITVISNVAAETRRHIDDMYPEVLGEAAPELACPTGPPDQEIRNANSPGVFAAVDAEELLALVCSTNTVIEIVPRVGDFLPAGALLYRVWHGTLDEARARALIAIEAERTPVQDPAFGFRQLVDIAVRALSPVVNDPTTAAQVIDHLHDLTRRLVGRRFPSRTRADESNALRVIAARLDFDDYLELAFDEIRHYGASSPKIGQRLRVALEDCLVLAPVERRSSIRTQLDRLERARRARHHA